MRHLTTDETVQLCENRGIALDDRKRPIAQREFPYQLNIALPHRIYQSYFFSQLIESALYPREACLAWVTDWGIFPTDVNKELYYRVRRSYGDYRLLEEAAGHYYLDYERPDLTTLIQIAILSGWDVHLLPIAGFGQASISHDENVWIGLGDGLQSEYERLRKTLEHAGINVS